MKNRILYPRHSKTNYAMRNASTTLGMARTPEEREQDRLQRLATAFLRPKKTREMLIVIAKEAVKTPAEREAERLWLQNEADSKFR
jgi:hypothetical protein